LGNVKSQLTDGRCWTFFRCSEVENGKVVWYEPPHPACRFRAFHTLIEGAADHLAFLRGMRRYAGAWEQVLAGDPRAFVRALKLAGYFTAAERPYEGAVVAIFARYKATLKFDVTELPVIDDDTRARTMDLLALHLREEGAELVAIAERIPPEEKG
jgi:flagellum-specific peptidoglycan hydrolase FlgJ